jgi:aryl-phospho-beta-D-glucosidase BglC (GH1 family)
VNYVFLSLHGTACSENGRRKITQNSIEVDDETKESTRKTVEKLDGRYKEGH